MGKIEYKDLGVVTKRHASGMVETDKGNRFPAGVEIDKGDQLVEVEGRKRFVKKAEWAEISKSTTKKQKFQKGVTKALRDRAAELEVEVFETTTLEELTQAIEAAELGGNE